MARYDGLIIPRSYSEYINKTDSATLQQALQQSGVLDSAPTEDSVKAVKSGGVYTALAGKQPTLTFDDTPTEDSDNPVKSGGIYDALATKQDTLTFDNAPTENSDNPVKSKGLVNSVPVDEVTSNNMHSVTSNAVYNAIGGSSIKTLTGSFTKANSDTSTSGYWTIPISLNISYSSVLAVYVETGSISGSRGLMLTPIYVGNSNLYINFYKPASWDQAQITFNYKIVYKT